MPVLCWNIKNTMHAMEHLYKKCHATIQMVTTTKFYLKLSFANKVS